MVVMEVELVVVMKVELVVVEVVVVEAEDKDEEDVVVMVAVAVVVTIHPFCSRVVIAKYNLPQQIIAVDSIYGKEGEENCEFPFE
ncbi:hypothetical protein L3X38_027804 [Prunus dulcis]|uniref:Uncharacterized protein n=1 Tax=Prunus dulcis TaxID=3755 RepID=A0AAD4VQI4_PRUDU|nr:hypothetical protein L3X38_027804 [Prunus dulcis]